MGFTVTVNDKVAITAFYDEIKKVIVSLPYFNPNISIYLDYLLYLTYIIFLSFFSCEIIVFSGPPIIRIFLVQSTATMTYPFICKT